MKMIDGPGSTKSTQLPPVSGHITVTREVTSDDDTELALEMLPVCL